MRMCKVNTITPVHLVPGSGSGVIFVDSSDLGPGSQPPRQPRASSGSDSLSKAVSANITSILEAGGHLGEGKPEVFCLCPQTLSFHSCYKLNVEMLTPVWGSPQELRQDGAAELPEWGAHQGECQHPHPVHGAHLGNADGENRLSGNTYQMNNYSITPWIATFDNIGEIRDSASKDSRITQTILS